jgi:hypothetical protein
MRWNGDIKAEFKRCVRTFYDPPLSAEGQVAGSYGSGNDTYHSVNFGVIFN